MAIPLIPLLAENFSRSSTSAAGSSIPAFVLREQPDVVIEEMVERSLLAPAAFPMPPPRHECAREPVPTHPAGRPRPRGFLRWRCSACCWSMQDRPTHLIDAARRVHGRGQSGLPRREGAESRACGSAGRMGAARQLSRQPLSGPRVALPRAAAILAGPAAVRDFRDERRRHPIDAHGLRDGRAGRGTAAAPARAGAAVDRSALRASPWRPTPRSSLRFARKATSRCRRWRGCCCRSRRSPVPASAALRCPFAATSRAASVSALPCSAISSTRFICPRCCCGCSGWRDRNHTGPAPP